ncbi:IS1 family transposase [Breznakiellaceae bacterium SP9]
MKITITITCPHCHSERINKNGKKTKSKKQNYICKDCGKQFIDERDLEQNGRKPWVIALIMIMLVRGSGIRDVAEVLKVSIYKVLKVLTTSKYEIKPKQAHYDTLEVDEFWTYVGNKKNKKWFIYAYHRETGEIVAFVWGKRDYKTAKRLLDKIKTLGITVEKYATDWWSSFIKTFKDENHAVGKEFTQGIEGNNCRIRHRLRRAFRRTCCFSKKLLNHVKAFNAGVQYNNYGFV